MMYLQAHVYISTSKGAFAVTIGITIRRKSKLPACYFGISSSPEIITNCSPLTIIAHLHPAFSRSGSTTEPQISIGAVHHSG